MIQTRIDSSIWWSWHFWSRIINGTLADSLVILIIILPIISNWADRDLKSGDVIKLAIMFIIVSIIPNIFLERRKLVWAIERVSVNLVAMDVCRQLIEFDFRHVVPLDLRQQLVGMQVLSNAALEFNPDGSKAREVKTGSPEKSVE